MTVWCRSKTVRLTSPDASALQLPFRWHPWLVKVFMRKNVIRRRIFLVTPVLTSTPLPRELSSFRRVLFIAYRFYPRLRGSLTITHDLRVAVQRWLGESRYRRGKTCGHSEGRSRSLAGWCRLRQSVCSKAVLGDRVNTHL